MARDYEGKTKAMEYVWNGAIPLQIHLHDSEVTTLPPPPPALILAPRTGYLPLLVSQIKPFFSSSLPPGVDTVWFEYKGLPLKWYIPTGVLFDILCAEPERPWNLTIHFRAFPVNILTPCEGEDSAKWSFINALKEAAYIISGNCKNIMNMSLSDQTDLWLAVLNGKLDSYLPLSTKLKLEIFEVDSFSKLSSSIPKPRPGNSDTDGSGISQTGRVPVRLYIRTFNEDIDDLEDLCAVDSWDKIYYMNRPVEVHEEEGKVFTLHDALKGLLPEIFTVRATTDAKTYRERDAGDEKSEESRSRSNEGAGDAPPTPNEGAGRLLEGAEIKIVRIQGIEPLMEIPFGWVVNNLMNPEHYLHISLYLKTP